MTKGGGQNQLRTALGQSLLLTVLNLHARLPQRLFIIITDIIIIMLTKRISPRDTDIFYIKGVEGVHICNGITVSHNCYLPSTFNYSYCLLLPDNY